MDNDCERWEHMTDDFVKTHKLIAMHKPCHSFHEEVFLPADLKGKNVSEVCEKEQLYPVTINLVYEFYPNTCSEREKGMPKGN